MVDRCNKDVAKKSKPLNKIGVVFCILLFFLVCSHSSELLRSSDGDDGAIITILPSSLPHIIQALYVQEGLIAVFNVIH